MFHLFKILFKALIIPFYRSHAGVLVFVFFVMFGMVESGQLITYHTALIEATHTSNVFMICVFGIWMVYGFKILVYILQLLRQPEYHFACELSLLSRAEAFGLLFIIQCVAFMPVIGYSIFIYQIGIVNQLYASTIAILLFQTTLCAFNALIFVLFLKTQHKFTWTIPTLRLGNPGGKIGFYISHFLNDEQIALLVSKAFSLPLLYFVKENTSSGDDFRIIGLAWLFALLSHTFLTLKISVFEDRYLSWTKALPVSIKKTYLTYFCFYVLLLLPETLLITTELGDMLRVTDLLIILIFSGGFMMVIHAYLLKPNRDADKFSTYLFWIFIASFVTILSKLIIPLTVTLCVLSFVRTSQRHYKYEPVM